MDEIRPDVIYTHHSRDLNVDHRVTYQVVLAATRPTGDYSVKAIYGVETVSSTEWMFGDKDECFFPQRYVDITEFFDRKCEAMRAYRSELCEFPHPRSIRMLEALATMRGGAVGVEKAEAFEVVREVVR